MASAGQAPIKVDLEGKGGRPQTHELLAAMLNAGKTSTPVSNSASAILSFHQAGLPK